MPQPSSAFTATTGRQTNEVFVSYLGAEGEKWSERLDSNQRPLSPQKTYTG